MNIVPFVHEGLGNSSYLIGAGNGTAILVDPDRTVWRYLDAAHERGWRIERVLETHLHADFVSGAHEIAAAVGARLFVPRDAAVRLRHEAVAGGERLAFDGLEIEVIASPGHTPEHMSYVLRAASGPAALFSGGSLIVGGAARTDLIAPEMTEPLTRAQYRTLRGAFASLPGETRLFPTHGGGSFCSAGASEQRTSTLAEQRASNPLLAFDDEEEFVRWFPATFPAVPAYYARMRAVNQAGPALRRDIAPPPRLSPADLESARGQVTIVDTRPVAPYMREHIEGSLSIPFRDAFAVWLGWLAPGDAALVFVTGEEPLDHVLDECLLVGYERFAGVIEGGMAAWEAAGLPVASAPLRTAAEGRRALHDGVTIVDVREPDEYASGHLPGAMHIPLGQLAARAGDLPRNRPILTYCGHGERSTTALSVLERARLGPLSNLAGGVEAWEAAGYELER
jgi:rhodanese-related sulfurtransferase/glyoxylase-like metal-dependent hydrolase (beta-lactamase superfamily II)